jgi:hypothetical protein
MKAARDRTHAQAPLVPTRSWPSPSLTHVHKRSPTSPPGTMNGIIKLPQNGYRTHAVGSGAALSEAPAPAPQDPQLHRTPGPPPEQGRGEGRAVLAAESARAVEAREPRAPHRLLLLRRAPRRCACTR